MENNESFIHIFIVCFCFYKMFRFTTTERNKQILNYLDFQYTVKRINKTCVEWRCRSRDCSSTNKKRRKNYDKIDEKLMELLKMFENGQLTVTELAIQSSKAVKIKKRNSKYCVIYFFALYVFFLCCMKFNI